MGKIYIGNKRECNKSVRCNNKNWERVGIIQIAKANLVDDPYNKIQLQTEFEIYFFSKKDISSCARVDN